MKILKRLISAVLVSAVTLGLSACSLTGFFSSHGKYAVTRAAEKQTVKYEDSREEGYLEFLSRLSSFSAKLSESLGKEYGRADSNLCVSPLSVYMALALAVECSEGETRDEILTALGMSYEEVSSFTARLYAFANKSYTYHNYLEVEKVSAFGELHNSLWLDDSVDIRMNTAEGLSANYHADIFKVPFGSGAAERAIKSYIKECTHGLVDGDVEMDADTVFVILNTLYLKELWDSLGKELKKTGEKYSFRNSDGSTESLKLLIGKYLSGKAYDGGDHKSFYARTSHGYELHFILPDQGVTASSVFTEENINTILSLTDYGHVDDENRQLHYTRVLFPEFEADFDENIDSVLKKDFGIERLFSAEAAELSLISSDNLYCQKVIHKTSIKVDEIGIEGAAITALPGAGAAGPPEYEEVYHDLVIDRAFGFVLTDPYGTVLFSGVINELD